MPGFAATAIWAGMMQTSRTTRFAFALAAMAGLLVGCARVHSPILVVPLPRATAAPDLKRPIDWQPLSRLLSQYVNEDGRVDYFRLSQPAQYSVLTRLYADVAASGPASAPESYPDRASKLAYCVNAYNLLALVAIAPYFGPNKADPLSINDLPVAPETGFRFTFDGRANLSLQDIRRTRIIPLLADDPRPLLALAAGRRNDPPLRREAYQPATLEAQLADQLIRVLRGEPWCEMNHGARRIELPYGIVEYCEWFWSGYLARYHVPRENIRLSTVLMEFADPRGRVWLNRAVGYDVVTAAPADKFNNQPLFRALKE